MLEPTASADFGREPGLPGTQQSGADEPIDVIVPVYGNRLGTLACLASVMNSTCRTRYELVVIEDAGPDPDLKQDLLSLASDGRITLLCNERNLGFPATCNKGFSLHPNRDVVILNSDTVVHGDWLDRLLEVAYSRDDVATVTPLTNNGTICSYPEFLQNNSQELELTPEELDQLCADVNPGVYVEAPTGVGFCMYVSRRCLDLTDGFDAQTFKRGYGEENDLCQRAIENGLTNLIAANIYVPHTGGQSFGPGKAKLEEAGVARVRALHPTYDEQIVDFVQRDPLAAARHAIDAARVRRRTNGRAILMVTHSWGGGTERHVEEMQTLLESSGTPVLICRPDPQDELRILISDPLTRNTPNISRVSIHEDPRHLSELLHGLGIGHVHIHNFAGYPSAAVEFFGLAVKGSGNTYDFTVHDYQSFCPQINLIDPLTGLYCGEPSADTCQQCVDRGSPFGTPAVWEWRRRYADLLGGARRVFTPSDDASRRVARHFPGLQPVTRPHLVAAATDRSGRPVDVPSPVAGDSGRPVRIGLLGAIGPHKGAQILEDVAIFSLDNALPLEFVVIGYTDRDQQLLELGNMRIHGRYEESRLDDLLNSYHLSAIWFPAIWPETYSYTLTSALQTGLPCVAFDLGAIPERMRQCSRGTILPATMMLHPDQIAEALVECGRVSRQTEGFVAPEVVDYPNPLSNYYGLVESE